MPGEVLTLGELSVARTAIAETIIRHRRARALVPVALHQVLQRIDTLLLTSAASANGRGETAVVEESNWMSTTEAAAQIGCTARRVRQIAPRIGGRRVGRRWIFPARAVREHAHGRN
jgi:hypothetical protein